MPLDPTIDTYALPPDGALIPDGREHVNDEMRVEVESSTTLAVDIWPVAN